MQSSKGRLTEHSRGEVKTQRKAKEQPQNVEQKLRLQSRMKSGQAIDTRTNEYGLGGQCNCKAAVWSRELTKVSDSISTLGEWGAAMILPSHGSIELH